jgi:hypothetical protein
VTTPLLELLPVPAERDLPPGRLELRAAALVEALEAAPSVGRVRRWLTALGLLVAAVALACSVLLAGSVRPNETGVAAKTVVVLAAGSGIVALAVAPRPPQLAGP